MGLIRNRIAFRSPASTASELANAATLACGLKVSHKDLEAENHRKSYAELFFEDYPDSKVYFFTFVEGAVRAAEEKSAKESGYESPIPCLGADDVDGIQGAYLQSNLGQETTLFYLLDSTLRSMPGYLPSEDDSDIAESPEELTKELLASRHEEFRSLQKKQLPKIVCYSILFVLALPFTVLWTILKAPFLLIKLWRTEPELFRNRAEQAVTPKSDRAGG